MPSTIRPQLMSMSSVICSYISVLVASLMDGVGRHPKTDPRPVVKHTTVAPPATIPVTETGRTQGCP